MRPLLDAGVAETVAEEPSEHCVSVLILHDGSACCTTCEVTCLTLNLSSCSHNITDPEEDWYQESLLWDAPPAVLLVPEGFRDQPFMLDLQTRTKIGVGTATFFKFK